MKTKNLIAPLAAAALTAACGGGGDAATTKPMPGAPATCGDSAAQLWYRLACVV